MTSPLLDRPGAVAAEGIDAGVAAHYGDPYREQRRLAAGEAVVDLSHRPVLEVRGPDRLTWLNDLTSQELRFLLPGVPTESLVLSPNGHVEHHLQLVDDGDAVRMHLEPGSELQAWLERMRFMLRVEITDVTADWAVLGTGSEAGLGWDLLPRAELPGVGEVAGVMAHEALRVAGRRPRLGLDTDHRTIPNETPWLTTAVHLAKGCYRGQETVARVANLGRPPRTLSLLQLDGSDSELPLVGADVLLDGRVVGRCGTAVRHHESGPLALALLKRQVPLDAVLEVVGPDGPIAASRDDEPVEEVARAVRPELMRFR